MRTLQSAELLAMVSYRSRLGVSEYSYQADWLRNNNKVNRENWYLTAEELGTPFPSEEA